MTARSPDALPNASPKLGWDDFLALPDDGLRYEILDGDLVMTPPPAIQHQRVSRNLQRILDRHIEEHQLGELLSAPVAVRLDDATIVEPDLLFIAAGRDEIVAELSINAPPDLVVEILSPSTARRDEGVKAQLYARFGVANYWILDPAERQVRVFRHDGSTYTAVATYDGAAVFAADPFSELNIDLARVWA